MGKEEKRQKNKKNNNVSNDRGRKSSVKPDPKLIQWVREAKKEKEEEL